MRGLKEKNANVAMLNKLLEYLRKNTLVLSEISIEAFLYSRYLAKASTYNKNLQIISKCVNSRSGREKIKLTPLP